MKRQHLRILNETEEGRGIYKYTFPVKEKEEAIEDLKDYRPQRLSFKRDFERFTKDINLRRERRDSDLEIKHFEYITIRSFRILGDDLLKKWGLVLMNRTHWGLTLTAQITDVHKFHDFMKDIRRYFKDDNIIHKVPQELKILTLIESFELLSSEKIIKIHKNNLTTSVLLTELGTEGKKRVFEQLINVIGHSHIQRVSDTIQLYEMVFESIDMLNYVVDNLDIIQRIQSVPTWHVSPSRFKMVNFNYTLDIDKTGIDRLPVIGLIDTGIRDVEAINDFIVERVKLDDQMKIACGHGTNVASLILFGRQPLDQTLHPQARIYSIQVIENEQGSISLVQLRQKIIDGIEKYKIKVFNLSMSYNVSKEINEGITDYAKVLDEIAYQYDVLFVTATGNIFWNAEEASNYPYDHYDFKNPLMSQASNIGAPAECMNGITVGAVDFLPNGLPAVYTRKSHLDYTMPFDKAYAEKAIINDNLMKPDVLSEGGSDNQKSENMIDVIEGTNVEFIKKSIGTSLAAPLISNLCARIMAQYPMLTAASIKSLVINTTIPTGFHRLDEAKQIAELRNREIDNIPNVKKYHHFSARRFARMMEGHGVVPRDDISALLSDDNEVTFVGEDILGNDEIKCVNLKLPKQLSLKGKKYSQKIRVSVTLCFMTQAVPEDIVRYNPFHVSFRFLNGKEKVKDVIEAIEYERCESREAKEAKKAERDILKIKNDLTCWSETPLPSYKKRLFSNCQHKTFWLNYSDVVHADHLIAMAFRCVIKPGYETIRVPFSYAIKLELVDKELIDDGFCLYDELGAINKLSILNIADLEAEAEI